MSVLLLAFFWFFLLRKSCVFNFCRLCSDNDKPPPGVSHSVSKYLILFNRNATGPATGPHPSPGRIMKTTGSARWKGPDGGLSSPRAPPPAPSHRHWPSPRPRHSPRSSRSKGHRPGCFCQRQWQSLWENAKQSRGCSLSPDKCKLCKKHPPTQTFQRQHAPGLPLPNTQVPRPSLSPPPHKLLWTAGPNSLSLLPKGSQAPGLQLH